MAVRQWKVPPQAAAAFPGAMVAAYALDLDGNGKLDWLSVDMGSQSMRVVRSDGSMGAVQQHRADPCPCSRSFADLDGDGWVEMLVSCECMQRWTLHRLDARLNFSESFRFRPGFVKDGTPPALEGLFLGAPLLEGSGRQRRVLGLAQTNNFAEDDESFEAEALPTLYFRSAAKGESLERLRAGKRAGPISLAELAQSRQALRWKDGLARPLEQRRLVEGDEGYSLDVALVQLGSNADPWPDPPAEAVALRKEGALLWHAPLDPDSACCRSALVRRGFVSVDGKEAAVVFAAPEGLELRLYDSRGLRTRQPCDPCLLQGGSVRLAQGKAQVLCGEASGIPDPTSQLP